MTRVLSVLILAIAGFVFSAGGASAQDIFVPADNGASNMQAPEMSPLFNDLLPQDQTQPQQSGTQQESAPLQAAPQSPFQAAPTNRSASRNAPPPRLPAYDDPNIAEHVRTFRTPQSATEFAVARGISPEKYNQMRSRFDAMAADNPSLQAHSPFAMVDLITEGQKYQQALANRVKTSCGMSNFTVMLDISSFMAAPKARQNLNANAIQPLGNVMDSICGSTDTRQRVAKNLFMFFLVNKPGAETAVTNKDGAFTITGDFAKDEPPNLTTIQSGIETSLDNVVASRRQDQLQR
jgi:hypothetical protein